MYKSKLIFLFISFCVTGFGQPIVTSNCFPIGGIHLKTTIGSSKENINRSGGKDQVWDFSKMDLEDISQSDFVSKNIISFDEKFADANVVFNTGEAKDFTFLHIDENKIDYLGFVADNDGNMVICKYDDPWVMYKLPLHLNDSHHDIFSSTSVVINNGDTSRNFFTGEYTYIVDGYGTLITPFSTYLNTLRINAIITGRDSSIRSGTMDTVIVNSYKTRKTSWISTTGNKEVEQASTFDFKDFFFQQATGSEINPNTNKNANNQITLFPDPANAFIKLKIVDAIKRPFMIYIIDNTGNSVKRIERNSLNNNADLQVSVSDLMPGIYYIKVVDNDREWKAKFVKQ